VPGPVTLSEVTPDFGPLYGGITVKVQGDGFAQGVLVEIGGAPAPAVKLVDAQTLEAEVPPSPSGMPGSVAVQVRNAGGAPSSLPDAFTYTAVSPEQEPNVNPSLGDVNDNPTRAIALHSGELRLSRVDMAIRGTRMGFSFVRSYRSGYEHRGALGHGWDANVFRRLEVLPTGNVLCFDGRGRVDEYLRAADGSFVAPRGFYTKLVALADGGFKLRDRGGHIDRFDAAGQLVSEEDRTGHRMDYVYDGGRLATVIDELGRAIDFAYDADGRLQTLRDFTDREVAFSYDADDNLVEVRSPVVVGTPHGNDFPAGKRERYVYDAAAADGRLRHNLVEVIAPNEVAAGNGPPRVVHTYGDSGDTLDRIVEQKIGGTNASGVDAGGTLFFAYDLSGSGLPAGAVRRTRVTDRRGNRCDYFHDARGHALRKVEDPEGPTPFVTTCSFNADGESISCVRPLGNEQRYVYDEANPDRLQQGNLLEERHVPDAARGGDQKEIITRYTYEPLFNQPISITLPRGNDPSYVPQNGGAQSAARYTVRHDYDWQEAATPPAQAVELGIAIPSSLLGLGDVNGDGRTDQALGERVRTTEPAATLLPGLSQAKEDGAVQEVITRYAYNDFGQLVQTENARGNIDVCSYFPENDPDGDGKDLAPGRDATTGGYVKECVRDAIAGPNRKDTAPLTKIATSWTYDRRGNLLTVTNGRGFTRSMVYNDLDQVVVEEDPKIDAAQATGYRRRYHYDANNNVVRTDVENQTTDPTTHQTAVVSAHPFFVHACAFDILDQQIECTRDATRDPLVAAAFATTQPEKLVTRWRYDANQNLERTLSPLAVSGADPDNVAESAYDARDLRVAETRGGATPAASTWTYAHDANGNRVKWTDAADNDGDGNPESATTVYDGFDRPKKLIDRAGNETTHLYDPDGRIVREELRGPVDGVSTAKVLLLAADHRFDELGRPIGVDRDLFVAAGVSLAVVSPPAEGPLVPGDAKLNERYEHDALGRLTFSHEDDGSVHSYRYDGADRRILTVTPLVDVVTPGGPYPTQTAHEYDASGNIVRTLETHTATDGAAPPAELETFSVFDALDRRVRETDAEGNTHRYEYDSRGNLVASYDGRGAPLDDPLGLYKKGQINDYGNRTRFGYDGTGRRWVTRIELTTTGEGGAPLDTANPSNPDGLITMGVEWDAASRMARRIDDAGFATTWSYDALDRIVVQTNPDGGARTMAYDRDHNVTQLVDENGTIHSYEHDGLDRRVEHALALGSAKLPGSSLPMLIGTTLQRFEYDGLGRPTLAYDDNEPADPNDDWTVLFRYDSLSRLLEEDQNGAVVGSSYEAPDSENRAKLHYPGAGRVVTYSYDALDRPIETKNPTSILNRWTYLGSCCTAVTRTLGTPSNPTVISEQNKLDRNKQLANRFAFATGELSTLVLPDAAASQRAGRSTPRNGNGDVSAFQVLRFGSQAIDGYTLEHDSADRLRKSQRTFEDDFGVPGPTLAADRLIELSGRNEVVKVMSGGVPLQQNTFNAAMERTSGLFLFNGSQTPSEKAGTGIRTADAEHVYQWDGLNRLRTVRQRISPSTILARYRYDAHPAVVGGRRVEKQVTNSGSLNGATRFYHDGDHVIEERTFNPLGGPEKVLRQFIYSGATDDVLTMDVDTDSDGDPDRLFFYERDANGNVIGLVRESPKGVEEFYSYDTFQKPEIRIHDPNDPSGQALVQVPASPNGNPYLFSGRRYEPETGLYYVRARLLDPVAMEFLSRDPLGFWGDPGNFGNPMAYAGNRPWTVTDPSGLFFTELWEAAKEKGGELLEDAEIMLDYVEEEGAGDVAAEFVEAVGETFESGEAGASVVGYGTQLAEHTLTGLTFGQVGEGFADDVQTLLSQNMTAEQEKAFEGGRGVGTAAGYTMDAILIGKTLGQAAVGGARAASRGVAALRGAGAAARASGSGARAARGASRLGGALRFGDSSRRAAQASARAGELAKKHAAVIQALERGPITLVKGSVREGLLLQMAEITVATGREVGYFTRSGKRFLKLGPPRVRGVTPSVSCPADATMIAHTHPSGILRFSRADQRSLGRMGLKSNILVGPSGRSEKVLLRP
jgi:RHS repeat-associated protein